MDDDQTLLRYISSIMVGVALYYGSISSTRQTTLQFIRDFHTRLAWSHLLSRHSRLEITRNKELCIRNSLRLPTYQELCERVERLCVSIQLKNRKCMVKKRDVIGFMKTAKKHANTKLLGLLTKKRQEIVYELYMLYRSYAL